MSDLTTNPNESISQESEIEQLARQADVPVEIVHRIYDLEREKLEKAARIKTYVPVLAHRRVKEQLLQYNERR
jgi:Protein of unknown function (DUF3562)